jgi:rhamnosyltransferase
VIAMNVKSQNNYRCSDVYAVIVTYNPDIAVLQALLSSLLPQVAQAIIVDNGSSVDMGGWFEQVNYENLRLHELGENFGIAHAQNVGIKHFEIEPESFILLSDQDSKPAENMVFELRKAAVQLMLSGKKVAAVGPCYVDIRQNNPPPFTKIEGLAIKRKFPGKSGGVVDVDYLIASGCLIPAQVLDSVGLMNVNLFIDYVDIEWGLRAKVLGFQSFGVFAAKMAHSLGDEHVNFIGRKVTLHSPLRHYYMVRNGFWLYKQKGLPLNWKFVDGFRMLLRICFYTLFAKPRSKHFSMMMRGVFHGVRSRMGRY